MGEEKEHVFLMIEKVNLLKSRFFTECPISHKFLKKLSRFLSFSFPHLSFLIFLNLSFLDLSDDFKNIPPVFFLFATALDCYKLKGH